MRFIAASAVKRASGAALPAQRFARSIYYKPECGPQFIRPQRV